MVNNFLLVIFALGFVVRAFHRGEYQRILKTYRILNSNSDRYASYVNLLRVFSLFLTDDPRWQSELEYMQKEGQISLLGEEDVKYISMYLIYISDGKLQVDNQMDDLDLSKVSKRTKKYFPMDMEKLKTTLEENKAEKPSSKDEMFFIS